MAISQFPAPSAAGAAASGLNNSQVFTTSGTWTVPAGVTYAHVYVRGGDGTGFWGGSVGGTSSAGAISAPGGRQSSYRSTNVSQAAVSALPGVTREGYITVTPEGSVSVTVGSGDGSCVIISWSGAS